MITNEIPGRELIFWLLGGQGRREVGGAALPDGYCGSATRRRPQLFIFIKYFLRQLLEAAGSRQQAAMGPQLGVVSTTCQVKHPTLQLQLPADRTRVCPWGSHSEAQGSISVMQLHCKKKDLFWRARSNTSFEILGARFELSKRTPKIPKQSMNRKWHNSSHRGTKTSNVSQPKPATKRPFKNFFFLHQLLLNAIRNFPAILTLVLNFHLNQFIPLFSALDWPSRIWVIVLLFLQEGERERAG